MRIFEMIAPALLSIALLIFESVSTHPVAKPQGILEIPKQIATIIREKLQDSIDRAFTTTTKPAEAKTPPPRSKVNAPSNEATNGEVTLPPALQFLPAKPQKLRPDETYYVLPPGLQFLPVKPQQFIPEPPLEDYYTLPPALQLISDTAEKIRERARTTQPPTTPTKIAELASTTNDPNWPSDTILLGEHTLDPFDNLLGLPTSSVAPEEKVQPTGQKQKPLPQSFPSGVEFVPVLVEGGLNPGEVDEYVYILGIPTTTKRVPAFDKNVETRVPSTTVKSIGNRRSSTRAPGTTPADPEVLEAETEAETEPEFDPTTIATTTTEVEEVVEEETTTTVEAEAETESTTEADEDTDEGGQEDN